MITALIVVSVISGVGLFMLSRIPARRASRLGGFEEFLFALAYVCLSGILAWCVVNLIISLV